MDVKHFFVNLAFASVAGAISGKLAAAWSRNKPAITTFFQSIDNWIEDRTGVNLPDDAQATYDSLVLTLVNSIEKLTGRKSFWLKVIQSIKSGNDSALQVQLLEELRGLDLENVILDALSPELKALVNDTKHQLAASVLKPLAPADTNVDLKIAQAARVVSLKKLEDNTDVPITPQLFDKLISDSKARQEKLRETP